MQSSTPIKFDGFENEKGVFSLAAKITKVELFNPEEIMPVAKEEEVSEIDSYAQIYFGIVQALVFNDF